MQRVWGEGFLTPGGHDFVLGMLGDLEFKYGSLTAEVSVGLGGAGCVVAREKNVPVTLIGTSNCLAMANTELVRRLNLGDRVTAMSYDQAGSSLPEAAFDHAFAKDGVPTDNTVLTAMHRALKPGGSFVVAQIVGDRRRLDDAVVATLALSHAVDVVSHDALREALKSSGFRIVKDTTSTEAFVQEIHQGWARFVASARASPLKGSEIRDVLALCEHWVRVAKAFQVGELAHHTIVAKRS